MVCCQYFEMNFDVSGKTRGGSGAVTQTVSHIVCNPAMCRSVGLVSAVQ